jgi:hypothetical protein
MFRVSFRWVIRFVLVRSVFAALANIGLCAVPIQHDFVAIDEGLGNLLRVNQKTPAENWIVAIGKPMPRDMQLIGNGRILIGHDAGYTEFDLRSGKVVKEVARYKGVTSVRRLPNGLTLIVGVNLEGSPGIVLLEVDELRVVHQTVLAGNYVRLVRETAQGTLLVMSDTTLREVTPAGATVQEWTVPGFRHAWKAVRLANGRTLASAGFGAFLAELDSTGTLVRKIGANSDALAAAHPNFYATFQVLSNGNITVANWQGHGPGHGAAGKQLLEFSPNGELVWEWSDANLISSLQGVLVLDGLDVTKLHDERVGVMSPIVPFGEHTPRQ